MHRLVDAMVGAVKRGWSERDVGDASGLVVLITGANSGLGWEATRVLSHAGASVIMGCRSIERGEAARARLADAGGTPARVAVAHLDLADLECVRDFADAFPHDRLDVLLNNAGVMAIPRRETADGFEMQLGTNHLGHFALTGLLLDRLLATPESRVVTVSSLVHRVGKMRFDDLHGHRSYDPWGAYAQSKLANLLFTFELQHRLERSGATVRSVAAHPGYSATNLQAVGPTMRGARVMGTLMTTANSLVAQDAAHGVLPLLYAAVGPDVEGGDYFGPSRFEMWGPPRRVSTSTAARNIDAARRLWEVSCEATEVWFEGLERSSSVLQ